jgi:hypothetical protein
VDMCLCLFSWKLCYCKAGVDRDWYIKCCTYHRLYLSTIQEIILCYYCLMHECTVRYQATCIFFWDLRFSQWCLDFSYSRVRHCVVGWVFPDVMQALQAVGCCIPWNKVQ